MLMDEMALKYVKLYGEYTGFFYDLAFEPLRPLVVDVIALYGDAYFYLEIGGSSCFHLN